MYLDPSIFSFINLGSRKNMLTITSWKDIPWASLYRDVETASKTTLELAEKSKKDSYDAFIKAKEQEFSSYSEAPVEQNLSEMFPYRPLTGIEKTRIKRNASADAISSFIDHNNIKACAMKLLPMIVTLLTKQELMTVSGEPYSAAKAQAGVEGSAISGRDLYLKLFQTDNTHRGLYEFLMFDTRSKYLETQYKGWSKEYCSLVPIIMYAYKLTRNIPYRHWNRADTIGIVNTKLADAMLWDGDIPSKEIILAARDEGLVVKTGAKAGTSRSPIYTHKLYSKHGLSDMPELAQVMYSQIWCAHPVNRSRFMILDPKSWDSTPEALISTEVLTSPPENKADYSYDPTTNYTPSDSW